MRFKLPDAEDAAAIKAMETQGFANQSHPALLERRNRPR